MDDVDRAAEREEIARNAAVKAASRDLPKHVQGECRLCGEEALLINNACTPCRAAVEARRPR